MGTPIFLGLEYLHYYILEMRESRSYALQGLEKRIEPREGSRSFELVGQPF